MQHSGSSESLEHGRASLYAAGFGSASVGVVVLGRAVDDVAFAIFAIVLMGLGFALSHAVRTRRIARPIAEGVLLSVLAVGTISAFVDPTFRYMVLPIQTLASSDLVIATILVWLMVVYSFNLRTDRAVLFICVPPLSLIGLMSTFDPSSQPLVFFILYLCFACFALVQQNSLSHATPVEHRRVSGNLKLSITITLQALVVGSILGWVLETVLDRAAGPSLLTRSAPAYQESYLDSNFMQVAAGPTVLGEGEVMTVNCAEALLWRSQVYDRYTGRGWMSTMPVGEQPELIASPGQRQSDSGPDRFPSFPSCFSLPADAASLERQHTRRVDQVITVTGGRITSIHGAAEPVFAAFRGPQMLLSASGRVSFRIPYSKGASYAVSSTVSAATPRELRSASTVYPRDVEDRYLQVPDSCRQIEPTLRELVGAMPTNYDKVVAIRNYLEANFVYDLTAPAAPPDEDAVVHFLLRSRRGYCDVFASSMAVMCRLSDIPSRVAVGFASGRRGPDDDVYHVRQRDRHAWVEVFFPGYGWITFDPAPQEAGTSLVSRLRSAWHAMVDAVAARSNSFWVLALLFCLIGYLVKVEGIDRMMRARRNATRSRASVGRAAENYRRMCDTFARLGYPRPISMTPREYCAGLETVLTPGCESLVPAVHAVTTDFIETRYARRDLPFDRVTLTSTLLSDLVREVRQAARQRLLGETGELRG